MASRCTVAGLGWDDMWLCYRIAGHDGEVYTKNSDCANKCGVSTMAVLVEGALSSCLSVEIAC